MTPSPFIRDHGAQGKRLGLDKNKAIAALNNLKNGSVTPKGAKGEQESKPRSASFCAGQSYDMSHQSMNQPQKQPKQQTESDSKFSNYTFTEAQKVH